MVSGLFYGNAHKNRDEILALLYLHRTFFIRAVCGNPTDPQHTKYGLSVSGAYDSAMSLIHNAGELFQTYPATMSRALLCWSHTLCSVFVLGTVITHCPSSRLAPLAAKRLDDANDLYNKASIYGGRALADSVCLCYYRSYINIFDSFDKPFVSRMAERSHDAIQAHAEYNRHSKNSNSYSVRRVVTKLDPENDINAIAVLGAHTGLIRAGGDTPASSANHSVYSPSQRHISPGITEASSQSDSSAFLHDRSPRGVSGDPEYLVSSDGSVASGMSPLSTVPALHPKEVDHQSTVLPTDPYSQGGTIVQGVPGYGYVSEVIQNGTVSFDTRNVQVIAANGQGPHYPGQVGYSPMDISADLREWNFLDDWYGHIFSLDVIPPDYGKSP